MAGLIGTIGEYDDSLENWESYTERFEQYVEANEVADERKVSCFLATIGPKTYSLLKNLCAPDKPKDKTYNALVTVLTGHLSPKPSEIAERFRFHKRDQRPNETVNEFVAELRRLAMNCDFGTTLGKSLRDRFVCGLRAEHIQKRLLTETNLTLDNAVKIAVAMETAGRDAMELQNKRMEPVNKISTASSKWSEKKQQSKQQGKVTCFRCGGKHKADQCSYSSTKCRYCSKQGHIEKVCFKKKRDKTAAKGTVHYVEEEGDDTESTLYHFTTFAPAVHHIAQEPILVTPTIAGKAIPMEVDTGSAVSLISQSTLDRYLGSDHYKLQPTRVKLKTYSGEQIRPLGNLTVDVTYNGQSATMDLLVVQQEGPTLLGRDWLQTLRLNWQEIKHLRGTVTTTDTEQKVKELLQRYKTVFQDDLGKLKGTTGSLQLQDDACPKFKKARQVPYALRPQVEKELQRLQSTGVISPVEFSDWATPVVPVVKPNGNVRLCGDYKVTLNPALKVDQYPLPRIDDIFASLSGGQKFTKIDLKQAYTQMEMDERSKELLTINTHKGLYRYNRLSYGIASAPAIWQKAMDQVLVNVNDTQCILDDMIITGPDDEAHLRNLETVFQRLEENGLKANLDKCEFFQESITYCGHKISKDGLHKTTDKVEAVLEAPRPENDTQLRSFLGMVNYYHRFLRNLSTVVGPLNDMLQSGKNWSWTKTCEEAFNQVKGLMASEQVLCHYDPALPLRLASDASPYGIGAVLSHVFPDGTERPVAFASRSLSKSEKRYSQIDKEALGIFWSVQKFHTYLYGRKFTLVTDHKPLVSIFHPSKALPAMTTARLQRYAIFLSGHTYDIVYRNTNCHGNADALSRLPLAITPDDTDTDPEEVFYTTQVSHLPVTSNQIQRETRRDPLLSQVLDLVLHGVVFPQNEELQHYRNRQYELTCHQGCLMWGNRVVVPLTLQDEVLAQLHESHPGIVRMKALARSYVWWPGLDADIEKLARRCTSCQQFVSVPTAAPIHPWDFPPNPWERLHVDFAGPFQGQMYFILVDAHSKWPEVIKMSTTTASATVTVLRSIFARFGVPTQLVSDNGPQFIADEFKDFLRNNGIKHITSAPYHPRTNGLAERFVQSFKTAMKKEGKPQGQQLQQFLLTYRTTPHRTTGETPAKLLMGRNLRTRLDLIKPKLENKVQGAQDAMMRAKHAGNSMREFSVGQPVLARDYRGQRPWITGMIKEKTGPLSYTVETEEGGIWRRHLDQLRNREGITPTLSTPLVPLPQPELVVPITDQSEPTAPMPVQGSGHAETQATRTPPRKPAEVARTPQRTQRYPTRQRKPPQRLDL